MIDNVRVKLQERSVKSSVFSGLNFAWAWFKIKVGEDDESICVSENIWKRGWWML